MSERNQGKQEPEKKFRVGGVSATVWKWTNTTKKGQEFTQHKASVDRTYRDKDGNWQHVNSYDVNDIPKAILALGQAYAYVLGRSLLRVVVRVMHPVETVRKQHQKEHNKGPQKKHHHDLYSF